MSAGFNHCSPEETAKRRARLELVGAQRKTRLADLYAARTLRRHHEILTAAEVLTELNNLMGSMRCSGGSDMERYRQLLAEVACVIEDDTTNVTA